MNDLDQDLRRSYAALQPPRTSELESRIMGVVRAGGDVRPGDPIRVELPAEPHRPLERV